MDWITRVYALLLIALLTAPVFAFGQSRIDHTQVTSQAFEGNKIGVAATRNIQVYLPASYDDSDQAYPVLYYLPSFFEDETALFETYNGKTRLDAARSTSVLDDVIVVAADFNTPVGGAVYTSSPVTGDWLKFIAEV